jgi:hypothetical protein
MLRNPNTIMLSNGMVLQQVLVGTCEIVVDGNLSIERFGVSDRDK